MFNVLFILIVISSVEGQLSVTWNGTTITGPVLIYSDELPVDPNDNTIGDPNSPGALICRSEDRARVSWHYTRGQFVRNAMSGDTYKSITTGEGVTPSVSRLSLNRENTGIDNPDFNGIWHCRLNAFGVRDGHANGYDEQVNVGIYSRGGGRGRIASNPVIYLRYSSFGSNPPTFTLVGDTRGGPPTTYTWTRNGEVITAGGLYRVSVAANGATEGVYRYSHYRNTLTVTGTLPGLYRYSVTNRATTTTRTSTFYIEGEPPSNLMVMQTGIDEVQVSWTALLGRYRVTADPGNVSADTAFSPYTITRHLGKHNISVTSLSHHFPGEKAGPVEITVRGALPPNVTTSSLTATSVYVSWTQPSFSFTPVGYTVTLTRVTGGGQVQEDTVTTMPPVVNSMEFTGLHKFSIYNITVIASFSEFDHLLNTSSVLTITTLSAAPSNVPQNVTVTTTSKSVSVSWQSIEYTERNGVITGYTVEFQEQGGASIFWEVVNQTFTASGLTPHTNYTFRVAGVNSNGTGPFTESIAIKTNDDIPGVVSNLIAVSRFTSIVITWNAPQHPNGVIIAYEVTYRVNDTNSTTINTTDISTTNTIELGLNTRVSGISVRAYTSVGPGNARVHHDVYILQNPTPPISMIVLVEPWCGTVVNVSWENVTVPGIVSYTVYYRPTETMGEQTEQSVTVPSTESSAVIEDIMTNVEYQFQVAAMARLDGDTYSGERSLPNIALITYYLPTTSSPTNPSGNLFCTTYCEFSYTVTTYTRDLSIAVILTFVLTIILCAVILLVGCAIHHARNSNRNKNSTTQDVPVYAEVDKNLMKGGDSDDMMMKKNEGYMSQ